MDSKETLNAAFYFKALIRILGFWVLLSCTKQQPATLQSSAVQIPINPSDTSKWLHVALSRQLIDTIKTVNPIQNRALLCVSDNQLKVLLYVTNYSANTSYTAEVFCAEKWGGKELIQYILQVQKDSIAVTLWDNRASRSLNSQIAGSNTNVTVRDNTLEISFNMPLTVIGVTQGVGNKLALQLVLQARTATSSASFCWSTYPDSYRNSLAFVPLRMDTTATPKSANAIAGIRAYWLSDSVLQVSIPNAVATSEMPITFFNEAYKAVSVTPERAALETRYTFINDFKLANPNGILRICNATDTLAILQTVLLPANARVFKRNDFADEMSRFSYLEKDVLPKPELLLLAHSYGRYWASFEEDFAEYNPLNRGFGGSRVENLLQYYLLIVKPFNPKVFLILNGGNDVNTGDTPENAFDEIKQLLNQIHTDYPKSRILIMTHPIYYYANFNNLKAFDDLLINFVDQTPWLELVDIRNCVPQTYEAAAPFLLPDRIHFNAFGYSQFVPVIKKVLQQGATSN